MTSVSSSPIFYTNDDIKKIIYIKFFFPVFLRLFIFSVRPEIYARGNTYILAYTRKKRRENEKKNIKKHKLEKNAGTLTETMMLEETRDRSSTSISTHSTTQQKKED